jgi:hypothetical protein
MIALPAGKTLVARALAAQASQGAGQPVSFFMRKGADVLSKWCVCEGGMSVSAATRCTAALRLRGLWLLFHGLQEACWAGFCVGKLLSVKPLEMLSRILDC